LNHKVIAFFSLLIIQEKFMQSEGIYRIPGSGIKVQAYRAQFDQGQDVIIGTNSPWEVDEATSIMINFLKNMQDGLFGNKKDDLRYDVCTYLKYEKVTISNRRHFFNEKHFGTTSTRKSRVRNFIECSLIFLGHFES
jgi:hypothetical protein